MEQFQALIQAEYGKLIIIIIIVSLPGFIALVRDVVRTRNRTDERQDQIQRERIEGDIDAARRKDEAAQETAKLDAAAKAQQLAALMQMAAAFQDQSKHIGRMMDSQERERELGAKETELLAKTKEELTEQGDTLDTVQALLVGQRKLIEQHRDEVKPTLDEVTDQGKRLADASKLLDTIDRNIKALPEGVQERISPIKDQIDKVDKEVSQLLKDVAEVKTMLGVLIEKASAPILPPADPLITPSVQP